MKRRYFIKSLGAISTSVSISPILESMAGHNSQQFHQKQQLTLKEYQDEHEEYPSMVTNHNGQAWLFSLRRKSYPEKEELISAFMYKDNSWQELDPVSNTAGMYEYPTASCAPGGLPCVAWSRLNYNSWCIEVASGAEQGFRKPFTFKPKAGKYIKPVLFASSSRKIWLAWEKYEKGRFSICLSKYEDDQWTEPVEIRDQKESLFDPAIAEDIEGNCYVAYGITSGVHQNIEMKKLHGTTLQPMEHIPIAIGGGLNNRVNINSHPALAIDKTGRLWITWENNRKTHRLEDGDNFTGDRICAMVCYEKGVINEPVNRGKWLFDKKNDHSPNFIKDEKGELFVITHCGGDFAENPFWKYRISNLDVSTGWSEPEILLDTRQKGQNSPPAMIIDSKSGCWLASRTEKWFENGLENTGDHHRSRLSRLDLYQYSHAKSKASKGGNEIALTPCKVAEHLPDERLMAVSGRRRITRKTMQHNGETFTLLIGNLHEHTEISSCWPAGCDGTIHDDYRFGMYSEGYDFMGITDHGYSLNEVYWRKNLRMVSFYSDNNEFIALPSLEWTLSNGKGNLEIKHGVGHKNIIFPSNEEAMKFIRNKDEVYSVRNDATRDASALWEFLHQKEIDCITIPHHPADEVHPTDWEVHDSTYQPIVEIFQCRGNAEYPGCPREINVTRHRPIRNQKAYIDYALMNKGYQMGFIASGDHNGIGVGLAAVWVKEISQQGIIEALKKRRCFATTGDKLFVHMTVNGVWGDEIAQTSGKAPEIEFELEAVEEIKSIEILRNSQVIERVKIKGGSKQSGKFIDGDYETVSGSLYYYMRIIQQNDHIAWSGPVWVKSNL